MKDALVTLKTIYEIVKNEANPETYLCSAREIILRQFNGWDVIENHLKLLEEREFVVVKHLDKIAISITQLGIGEVNSGITLREKLAKNSNKISD